MKQKQGLCAYRVLKVEHLYSPSCREGFFWWSHMQESV